jgi:sensor histidine kinase YesM
MSDKAQFWVWQSSFWFFTSVISIVTLTLWYSSFNWVNVAHVVFQAALGLLFSLVLYRVFMLIWDQPILYRLFISTLLIFSIAFVWTIVRMYALSWLTDFDRMWDEFGGWYFASIFVFLCWGGLFHGIRYYELLQREHRTLLSAEAATRREHVKRIEAQSIARDAQIKMLRYQLNPHFLYNTLNAINSLIEIDESDKAQQMTVQLSQFLRHSLDTNPNTKVTLELTALNLYLEIEKVRFGERLHIEINITEPAGQGLVPSLLLQPVIENSMKYAVAMSEGGGTIKIRAFVDTDQLHIQMSDTGADELQQSQSTNHREGVGISNIHQRLQSLYEDKAHMAQYVLETGGLETHICMPFEQETITKKAVNQ